MNIKEYLEDLNTEDACGFAIDSFPEKKVLRVAYPNENIEEYDNLKTKRIMIDLDGVIHDYNEGFKDGTLYGKVIKGTKEAIQELRNNGYLVIIFTARLSVKSHGIDAVKKQRIRIKKWLQKNGIEVDGLTSEKLPADVYIDDRAIEFTGNWKDTLNKVNLRLG